MIRGNSHGDCEFAVTEDCVTVSQWTDSPQSPANGIHALACWQMANKHRVVSSFLVSLVSFDCKYMQCRGYRCQRVYSATLALFTTHEVTTHLQLLCLRAIHSYECFQTTCS